jgi:hypothetical protein
MLVHNTSNYIQCCHLLSCMFQLLVGHLAVHELTSISTKLQLYAYLGVTQRSVNWLVNVHKNTLEMSLLLTEFAKIVRNEILHVQCTTHCHCTN